ncbi:MAG TPA: hypothetical protein VIX59_15700 [Candidatus Binataceae bacterium]
MAVKFNYKGLAYLGAALVAMRFAPENLLEFVCALGDKPLSFALGLLGDANWDGKADLDGQRRNPLACSPKTQPI